MGVSMLDTNGTNATNFFIHVQEILAAFPSTPPMHTFLADINAYLLNMNQYYYNLLKYCNICRVSLIL